MAAPTSGTLLRIPASTVRPCAHNGWDSVRTYKKTLQRAVKVLLRCRACGEMWRIENWEKAR
eukprot:gene50558-52597_t